MSVIIQLKGGTAAKWQEVNPTLAEREMGIETDTHNYKIGDGFTSWNSLEYSSFPQNAEDGGNKVTIFDNPTDIQYPSAKLVYDQLEAKEGASIAALNNKVDKITGKSLSDQNFTLEEKTKLSTILANANPNIIETIVLNGSILTPSNKEISFSAISPTEKGSSNGIAELDGDGIVPLSQLPSYVSTIVDLISVTTEPVSCSEGDKYYNSSTKFIYTATGTDTWGETGVTPIIAAMYYDTITEKSYRWSGSTIVEVAEPTSLVEERSESSTTVPTSKLLNNELNKLSMYGVATGTAQAQVLTVPATISALTAGMRFTFIPVANNTAAAPTLNVNGLGAKTIILGTNVASGTALIAADITINVPCIIIYDGTNFRLQNPQNRTATSVKVTPTGGIVATNVQDALEEIELKVEGKVYDGSANISTFHLTTELNVGDKLVFTTDKTYQSGAVQFRDAEENQIAFLLFSAVTINNYTVPSNYKDCVLIWDANWDNLTIVRQNNTLSTKIEGVTGCIGKNIYNSVVRDLGYILSDQVVGAAPAFTGALSGFGVSELMPVSPNGSYFISADSVCAGFYKLFLDENGNVASLTDTNGISFADSSNNMRLGAPSNAHFLILTTKFVGVDCVNLQVELGEIATTYEEYKSGVNIENEKYSADVKNLIYKVAHPSIENEEGEIYASIGDSLTEGLGNANDSINANEEYVPIVGTSKKTYAYFIARANKLKWCNYGVSGSTLGDVVVNGVNCNGFTTENGRYTQMRDNLNFISLWFGWNDAYNGPIMKREEWLKTTYGSTIYFTSDSSKFGTNAPDGNPYCTQAQYNACIALTGSVGGVEYTNNNEYFNALYIGVAEDTTNKTWYGAFNISLPYLIAKYPLSKILIIIGYGGDTTYWDSAILMAKKYGVGYLDLSASGKMNFITKNGTDAGGNVYFDATNYTNRTYYAEYSSGNITASEFRHHTLLYDGTHPNKYGYKYLYSVINGKLMEI